MDYVVAGFGIGAVLALIGFALWELFGTSDEGGAGWLVRAAIGSMLGALVIWAITGVSLISTVDDSTGSHLVLLTTVVTLLAIVIVSFWYWRMERSLPNVNPERRAVPAGPLESTEPATAAEIELSEWDTWPERDQHQEVVAEPLQSTSFEPETAAEPVASSDAAPEDAQDIVLAVEARSVEPALSNEGDRTAEHENEAADQSREPAAFLPASLETETNTERPAQLPGNMRPFRPRPVVQVEDAQPVVEDSAAEPTEPEQMPETQAPDVDRDTPFEEADVDSDEPAVKIDLAPAAAFESSLLADIDGSTASGDGRYQSPLLADLESSADVLEEIGLAKWRPEDRLIADEPEEPPKRRRK